MNKQTEILQSFQRGELTLAECWDMLKDLRQFKPNGEPDIKG
jgi:hypothetical protein